MKPDNAIVISQDDLYSIAWEAESDPSPLGSPTIYLHPVATETTNSRKAVSQRNNDKHSSQRHSDASDFVTDDPHSHKHSSQGNVNVPKIDLRNDFDAHNKINGSSKPCHDINSRPDLMSNTSTEVNIPSNDDDFFQEKIFSRGGKYNLRPSPKPGFSGSYRY